MSPVGAESANFSVTGGYRDDRRAISGRCDAMTTILRQGVRCLHFGGLLKDDAYIGQREPVSAGRARRRAAADIRAPSSFWQ